MSEPSTLLKERYEEILNLDKSIRFVGRIKDRNMVTFVRREYSEPLIDEEMVNMAHYQASVKANMEEMFDSRLGKTTWMVTCKEFVKMITIFLDDGLLILSMENYGDHDHVIKEIRQLDMKL